MATSNSVDFTVNRNEIITAALEAIGSYAAGETLSAADVSTSAKWLNLIVKQWQGSADFAPGIKEWSRKRGYIFLQSGQQEYNLGPSGDHATSSYTRTTISADEASGQTVLSVTTSTGMTAADIIGIVKNDNTIHWTTVSTTGAGTVTVAVALTAAASAGNYVYWYTTKLRRPIKILTASLRDEDSNDTPLNEMSLYRYESIVDKGSDSDPTSFYYERQLTNGKIYFDAQPNDLTRVVRIVFLSAIEDFDTATDTPDYPQEFNLALVMELAKHLAPVFGVPWKAEQEDIRKNALAIAKNLYPETSELYFQPG